MKCMIIRKADPDTEAGVIDGPFAETREPSTSAGGDLDWCHFLHRCGTTDSEGRERSNWMRGNLCLRRFGGDWHVVYEHFSVPFEMDSGKPLFDLQP